MVETCHDSTPARHEARGQGAPVSAGTFSSPRDRLRSDPAWYGPPPLLPWQLLLLAYILGLYASAWPAAGLAGLGLLRLLCGERLRGWRQLAPCLGLFVLGALVGTWQTPRAPATVPSWMTARTQAQVTGLVEEVETRPEGRLQITLGKVDCVVDGGAPQRLPGRLLWTWEQPGAWPAPGETVSFRLRVKPVRGFSNQEGENAELWWTMRGIFYRAWSAGDKGDPRVRGGQGGLLWNRRQELRNRILNALDGEQEMDQGKAALMALLFGDRFFLTSETLELMSWAGLSHSLALSGLHVGYVAAFGLALAWLAGRIRPGVYLRLPRARLAVLCGTVLGLLYLWLGGVSPSLLRAFLMYAFWGLLLWQGRSRVLLDGLFLALACMIAVQPLLVFDLRLQLSAGAVASIALYCELRRAWLAWRTELRREDSADVLKTGTGLFAGAPWSACPGWLYGPLRSAGWLGARALDMLFVSLAAQLALAPVLFAYFQPVSLNLYLNILWLPVLGLAILPSGMLGLILSTVSGLEPAGAWLLQCSAWLTSRCLEGLIWWSEQGGLDSFATLIPSWPALLGYWGLLAGMTLWRRQQALGSVTPATFAALACASVLLVWPWIQEFGQELRGGVTLRLLDVGQGQALVLEYPWGRRLLVDGGGLRQESFDIGRRVVGPYLLHDRSPRLEAMALTHADIDHYQGLLFPGSFFSVGAFYYNGDLPKRIGAGAFTGRTDATAQVVTTGARLNLTPDLILEVLHPPAGFRASRLNDRSLVLRVLWQGQALALLPGDLCKKGFARLLADGHDLSAQSLVLPHHGGKDTPAAFLDRVRPRLALASAGYLNQWSMPVDRVRSLLAERAIPLWSTSHNGAIAVRWSSPDAVSVTAARHDLPLPTPALTAR